jgi:hypothetical protein
MDEPLFDIFSGTCDKNAMWIEAAAGLAGARERMKEIAARDPGEYFIFSQRTHAILARIDTRKTLSCGYGEGKAKSA